MEAIHNYVEALFAVLPQREDVLRVKDDCWPIWRKNSAPCWRRAGTRRRRPAS